MVEVTERYVIYDVDTHEKLGEFESQEFALAFIGMVYDTFMIDNLQIQRIKNEIEQTDVESEE